MLVKCQCRVATNLQFVKMQNLRNAVKRGMSVFYKGRSRNSTTVAEPVFESRPFLLFALYHAAF